MSARDNSARVKTGGFLALAIGSARWLMAAVDGSMPEGIPGVLHYWHVPAALLVLAVVGAYAFADWWRADRYLRPYLTNIGALVKKVGDSTVIPRVTHVSREGAARVYWVWGWEGLDQEVLRRGAELAFRSAYPRNAVVQADADSHYRYVRVLVGDDATEGARCVDV